MYKSDGRRTHMTHLLEWPAGLSLCLRDQQTSPLCLSHQWISPFAWETSGPLPFAWKTSRSLPSLEWTVDLCLQSKFTDLILSFKSHAEVWTSSSPHVFFCLRLVIGTYILPFFFQVTCWAYLRTEISVTLYIGNKLYSLSCETTLLMLSCDRIWDTLFYQHFE